VRKIVENRVKTRNFSRTIPCSPVPRSLRPQYSKTHALHSPYWFQAPLGHSPDQNSAVFGPRKKKDAGRCGKTREEPGKTRSYAGKAGRDPVKTRPDPVKIDADVVKPGCDAVKSRLPNRFSALMRESREAKTDISQAQGAWKTRPDTSSSRRDDGTTHRHIFHS